MPAPGVNRAPYNVAKKTAVATSRPTPETYGIAMESPWYELIVEPTHAAITLHNTIAMNPSKAAINVSEIVGIITKSSSTDCPD